MKLRVETSASGGVIVEYEGDDAAELVKLVLKNVLSRESVELASPSSFPWLKVLDWGANQSRVLAVLRALWPNDAGDACLPLAVAKKWVDIAPMVLAVPEGHPREAVLEQLRAAGVTVE